MAHPSTRDPTGYDATPDSRNNIIYHNGVRGIGAGGIHLADEPDCGLPSSHNLVANNTIVEDEIPGIQMTQYATGTRSITFSVTLEED